ncbi:phage tail protein [Agrococcus casei]|uniref:Phage tail length tape-measure protein \|nr:tape measure protein [Agrococcus casei]SJM66805.1 Phage tail length tape-measure protein \
MAKQTVIVSVLADTAPFTRGMKNVSSGIGGAISGIGKLALGVAGAAAGITAAIGAIAIKGGLSRALNIEDAQAKLKGLGYDTVAIGKVMDAALGSVKGTAFGLDSAVTAAAGAMAAGVKEGAELEKYLTAIADASAIAGISMDDMGAIFNKIQANGKLTTQELNQLADRGIPVLSWLSEEFGVTAEEMRKMVTSGAVDAEAFRNVIEENIGGAALASAETTRGAFANMGAALSRFGEVLAGGVLPIARESFSAITVALDAVAGKVKPFADAFWESAQGTIIPALQAAADSVAGFLDGFGGFGGLMATVQPIIDLVSQLSPLRIIMDALAPVSEQLGETFSQLAGIASDAAAQIGPLLAPVLEQLGDLIGSLVATVLPPLIDIFGSIAGVVMQLAPVLLEVATVVLAALTPALDSLGPLLALVATVVGDLLTALAPLLESLIGALAPILGSVLELLAPLLELFTALMTPILELVAPLVELLVPALQFLVDVIVLVVDAIVGLIGWFVDLQINALENADGMQSAWAPVAEFFTALWDGISSVFADAWDAITTVVSNAWNVIKTIFETVGQIIQQVVAGAILFIVNIFKGDFAGAANIVRTVWDNIQNLFSGAIGKIRGFVSNMVGAVVNFFSGMMNRARSTVSSGMGNVVGIFRDLPGKILGFVRSLPGRFAQIGSDIIRGLINGIHNMAGWLRDAVSNVVGGVVGWAKSMLGISSPSKVFRDLGRFTVQGLEQGLSGPNRLRSLMGGLATSMESAFDPSLSVEPFRASQARTAGRSGGITVNITAGVGDPVEIGREVMRTIKAYQRSGGMVTI